MSKTTRNLIIIGAVLVLVIMLAVLLPSKAKALLFGVLYIVVFIAVFAGLVLGINYLNVIVFPRPRNPTHLCHHCLSLYQDPEEAECEYCFSEFGEVNPVQLLGEFMEQNSEQDIQARLDELKDKHKTARGRNILYIEHDMKMANRLLRMKNSLHKPVEGK